MLRNRTLFFAGLIFAGIIAAASAQMVGTSLQAMQPDPSLATASTITTNPGVINTNPVPTPSPALKTVPQATLFPAVTDYGNPQGPPTSSILTDEQDARNRSLKEIMRPPVPVSFTPYSANNPYANKNPYANQVGLPSVDLNAPLHSTQAPVISGPSGASQITPATQGSTAANASSANTPSNLAAAIAQALQAMKANGGGAGMGADSGDTWRHPPRAGVSADLKDVKKQSIVPPFVISAASRSLDLSRIWWSPELLSVRIGRPTGGEEGVVVPWRRSPAGFPAAILIARLPTIENRQIIIKQAVSMMWIDGSWVAEGSSMAVSLKGKNGEEETLITPADGQGMWRIRMAQGDSVEVWRWIAAGLNGCRTTLAEKLNNEELRQLLINSGEVVWRISPDHSLSKT